MKKILLASVAALGISQGVNAQETTDKNDKIIDGVTLLAESTATNPFGLMIDNAAAGYLASVQKNIGENTTISLNDYFSATDGIGHNPSVKLSHNLTPNSKITTNISGKYFFPNGDRPNMGVLSAKAQKGGLSVTARHWNFLDGNSLNNAEIALGKEFNNKKGEYIADGKLKITTVLDNKFNHNDTFASAEVSKKLANKWNVRLSAQTSLRNGKTNVGFGVVKKF